MRKLLLLSTSSNWEDLEKEREFRMKKRKLQRRREDSRVKKRGQSSVIADSDVTAVIVA